MSMLIDEFISRNKKANGKVHSLKQRAPKSAPPPTPRRSRRR